MSKTFLDVLEQLVEAHEQEVSRLHADNAWLRSQLGDVRQPDFTIDASSPSRPRQQEDLGSHGFRQDQEQAFHRAPSPGRDWSPQKVASKKPSDLQAEEEGLNGAFFAPPSPRQLKMAQVSDALDQKCFIASVPTPTPPLKTEKPEPFDLIELTLCEAALSEVQVVSNGHSNGHARVKDEGELPMVVAKTTQASQDTAKTGTMGTTKSMLPLETDDGCGSKRNQDHFQRLDGKEYGRHGAKLRETEVGELEGLTEAPMTTQPTEEKDAAMIFKLSSLNSADELEDSPARSSTNGPLRKRCLSRVVGHPFFEGFFTVVLLSNSIFTGVQADFAATSPSADPPLGYRIVSYIYAGLFTVELCMRFVASGPKRFFTHKKEVMWNMLDLVTVASSAVEILLEVVYYLQGTSNQSQNVESVRLVRILRVSRLLRTLRVARIVRFIRALRTLVISIVCTLKTVFWAMMLLGIIIYVFALLFVQAVGEHKMKVHAEGLEMGRDLDMFWGSLARSMFTLYKTIAGGLSWHDAVYPLNAVGTTWVWLFIIYVAFTVFAVLNVITGVFCESAIESAKQDQEMVIQQRLANKRMYTDKLKKLFQAIDDDGSNALTTEEFEAHFQNEQAIAFFEYMGIELADAREIIHLIDGDNSGAVDLEEFVVGCLRLRGPARAIDVAQLSYEVKTKSRTLIRIERLLRGQFGLPELRTSMMEEGGEGSSRGSVLIGRDWKEGGKDIVTAAAATAI
eukprot:TRINITY_DN11090_c0_g2_i1.p1 TRINITY_DN11090_c0_g2~~TRINITY_DN11090_c0_g2_i1.p1  ORF type:complete len:767 (-),score=145.66 TRINITY_DN11090_c0_g2_i1:54-2261(-)